jgi:hypothetical protein
MMSLTDATLTAVRPCTANCGQTIPLADRRDWFGTDASFHHVLEHSLDTDVTHRGQVTRRIVAAYSPGSPRMLQYRHAGVDVPSRGPVPVLVEFPEYPLYNLYGRPVQDYPRVFADIGADSPHRLYDNNDDALCLYYPYDPPGRSWCAGDGLAVLFNLAANHLFFELHWRATGGFGDSSGSNMGTWLGDELPHAPEVTS